MAKRDLMSLLSAPLQQTVQKDAYLAAPISPVEMNRVAAIILGGGEGKRLSPLTITRCKPAMCFGGKYLLIDIPISNAINSGCRNIFILTQFLSTYLHQHIFRTYRPGTFPSGCVELLSAEQGPINRTWFQGTADAVRQNASYFLDVPADYFLILSGDQLYNINFQDMVRFAKETDADLVVAALPVNESDARRMGVLKLNEDRFITEFCEKPQDEAQLDHMRLQEFTMRLIENEKNDNRQHLGSMGIYLFKRKALFDLLKQDPREDFGKHLIPTKVSQGNVAAYLYNGYWEDIGTIDSFFNANIALTYPKPNFNCYDERNPIFSQQYHLPPPKISDTRLKNAIICEGSIVDADEITNSILGLRSVIKQGTNIRNSYIIGNDFYTHPHPDNSDSNGCSSALEIGENCVINRAIIDKNVCIGNAVHLTNKNQISHYNSDHVYIRDGIIIVTRGANLPNGFSI